MTPDDRAYRASVRNMVLVLTAVVITVFAAIFIPPLVYPAHEQFLQISSVNSPYGFSLSLRLNATQSSPGGSLTITGWMNNTSSQVNNVTARNQWSIGPSGLWQRLCTSGWPLGLGVMRGYFTSDNYTLGTLVRFPMPLVGCPVSIYVPNSFLMAPHGSKAIVKVGSAIMEWDLTTTLSFGATQPAGVYTAIAADEWGDVAITHFRISP